MTASLILDGVLLPAVVCGLVLAIAWKAWRRESEPPSFSGALAIGAGFLAGFVAISGIGALPRDDRTMTGLDWTFWGCIGGVLLFSYWESSRRARRSVLLTLRCVLVLPIFPLERVLYNSAETGVVTVVIAGLAWLVLVLAARCHGDKLSRVAAPVALWTSATGLAVVAALSGSAKLAQLSGAVAAALGAIIVLCWWRPRIRLSDGGTLLVFFALFALGLNAHYYSYTTGTDALLLGASLLTPLAIHAPRLRELAGARRAAAIFALALVPVAVAVTRAALAFETDPYAGY